MRSLNLSISLVVVMFFGLNTYAQNTNTVFTAGAMSSMGPNYNTVVKIDTLAEKAHLYGMGPYDRMKGEITIFDGKPFYASAFEEGKSIIGQSWNIKSPFFVYANVPDWNEYDMNNTITSVADIQNFVADIAKKNGYDLKEPFAFKIEGDFKAITCHIVTPRNNDVEGYREGVKQQLFSFEKEKGSILGFYSEEHQGVFTSSKSFVHVHYLRDDVTFMGHLDKITTTKALKLYLPAKPKPYKIGLIVNDTDFSKGKLGNLQDIELKDLEKFHGHLCDGLVVGYLALQEALAELYPDGVIDRTNTRIVSKSSPCLTDAAIYITGGRYQFNSFYVSDEIDELFVVERIDTKKTVSVSLNKGVKPKEIGELGAKAVKGELMECDLDKLKKLEDDFSEQLLSTNPKDNFTVVEKENFKWEPVLKTDFVKTDVLNKNQKE